VEHEGYFVRFDHSTGGDIGIDAVNQLGRSVAGFGPCRPVHTRRFDQDSGSGRFHGSCLDDSYLDDSCLGDSSLGDSSFDGAFGAVRARDDLCRGRHTGLSADASNEDPGARHDSGG
jgi:hypothetical protein